MNSLQGSENATISICLKCGKTMEPIYIGGRWTTPLCSCESSIKLKKSLEDYEKLRLKDIVEDTLGVNQKIKDCSFENFKPRLEVAVALKYAKGYVENITEVIKNGHGILFVGGVGTGKSHLSAAIANAALQSGFVVVYEVITELLSKIRSTYSSDEMKQREATEHSLLDTLCSCDLLILDDLGTEKTSTWTESIIYTIVNKRYALKKPTIASTNLDIRSLYQKLGPRTMDRLIEMNRFIVIEGESYRKIIAKERIKEDQDGNI